MDSKKIFIIITFLLAIVVLVWLIVFNKPSQQAPNSNIEKSNQVDATPELSEEEAIINNANPNLYSFVGDAQAEKIDVEFMSDTEKDSLGIPIVSRIQVIERDSEGKCIAWKLINQDSEIIYEYVR